MRLRFRILALHSLKIQRRLAHTSIDVGREFRVNGLGGSEAFLARPGGGRDGNGVLVEMLRHGVPDVPIEAVIVAKVQVVAAEAAVVLVEY